MLNYIWAFMILVGLMAGVGVLRASGFMGALGRLLGGVTEHIGMLTSILMICTETIFLHHVRVFSGGKGN